MSEKNILIISKEFPPSPGGIGRHAADLAFSLFERGYRVDVIANMSYVKEEEIRQFLNALPEGIQVTQVPIGGVSAALSRSKVVAQHLLKKSYEKIIVTGLISLWLGGITKLFKPSGSMEAFVHGSELNSTSRFLQFLTRWSLYRMDKIWPVSNFTASLIPNNSDFHGKIQVLPNGIRAAEWEAFSNSSKYEWQGEPVLLTVGNLSKRKGQHRVIKALPHLITYWPRIHYHIVGYPSEKERLDNLIDELKVNKYCTIQNRLPGRENIAKAYKSADVFIMLSENQPTGDVEGFGIAILEANSLGIPAIGALGCGIEDAIQNGFNGELVDGDDPEQVNLALTKIINSYDTYSVNAKEWALKHDWNNITKEFIDH